MSKTVDIDYLFHSFLLAGNKIVRRLGLVYYLFSHLQCELDNLIISYSIDDHVSACLGSVSWNSIGEFVFGLRHSVRLPSDEISRDNRCECESGLFEWL